MSYLDEDVNLKIEHKYCEDLLSAFKLWDNSFLVYAYSNAANVSTMEETKLKDRLRKKKQRINSIMHSSEFVGNFSDINITSTTKSKLV